MGKLKIEEVTLALQQTNERILDASKILNCSYGTLKTFAEKNSLSFCNQKPHIDPIEAAQLYEELGALSKVAEKMGCTKEGVRLVLKRYGYTINAPIERYLCNENFFKQESEESFYWAGFLAADGCVKLKRQTKVKNTYKQLSLALCKDDKNHVELFKKHVEFNGKIFDLPVKNKRDPKNSNWKSELTISSDIIFDDLAKFNIVPRKTLIYTFPEWLMEHPLVHHFLRGYFDGDGSIYFNLGKGKKTKQAYFNVLGTQAFLEVYRNFLDKNCSFDECSLNKNIRKGSGNVYSLEYGGNNIVSKIYNYLYKDAKIFLKRKKEKFEFQKIS